MRAVIVFNDIDDKHFIEAIRQPNSLYIHKKNEQIIDVHTKKHNSRTKETL